MLGGCGESTAGDFVRQEDAVTRLSHKKMLRRVRLDVLVKIALAKKLPAF